MEDQGLTSSTDSYDELKNIISQIEYSFEDDNINDCTLTMNAYLPKIRLESLNKDFDLMMLWKFNKPELSATLAKDHDEN